MPLLLLVDFAVLLLIRFFIKIVITIFGWATNIFFGEIKDKNKVWFYIMILLSFVWIYCVAAKAFPAMFTIFVGYIPERSVTKALKRIVYVLCLAAIPPAVGFIETIITGIDRKDKKRMILSILGGYISVIRLGLAMAVMLVCTPVIRCKRMLRHTKAKSMSMGVAGKGNIYVMDEIIISLAKADIKTVKKIPSKFYSIPVKMLNAKMKKMFNYVSDREIYISGENISIYLNSSDIMLEGREEYIEKAKMAIVRGFVENDIFLTESEKAQLLEKEILTIYRNWEKGVYESDEAIEYLKNMIIRGFTDGITYDEWALLSVQMNEIQNKILDKKTNVDWF